MFNRKFSEQEYMNIVRYIDRVCFNISCEECKYYESITPEHLCRFKWLYDMLDKNFGDKE